MVSLWSPFDSLDFGKTSSRLRAFTLDRPKVASRAESVHFKGLDVQSVVEHGAPFFSGARLQTIPKRGPTC